MSATKEMPLYQSCKRVWALLIKDIKVEQDGSATITPDEEGYAPFSVSKAYMDKHTPLIGGYYVQYENGYESWSPADVFLDGYFKIVLRC